MARAIPRGGNPNAAESIALRVMLRLAAKLGSALNCLATIVHPDTIRRWAREATKKGKAKLLGRPRTRLDMCKLILRLANENDTWGYARIIKRKGVRYRFG